MIDNASLDSILQWTSEARARLATAIANRRLVVYLAPESIAELFAIGATSRAARLQPLATLTLELFNGRILRYHFWRILDEVRRRPTGPFMPAGMSRRLHENLNHFAKGGTAPDPSWFQRGAEMISREKMDDQCWPTRFQKIYRSRDRQREGPRPLDEFVRIKKVRDLVRSRVEAICVKAALKTPAARALEIIDSGFAGCRALAAHVYLRIARLWWYTEATPDGRRASADLFDDALLNYLAELDMLLTPDRGLSESGATVFPEKSFLSPASFRDEYLGT